MPITRKDLIQINENLFEIPQSFRPDMLVPARIFINEQMLNDCINDRSIEQLVNITTLPGIKRCAYAMPDIHQGYGFPIGGVAGTDTHNGGVISPGGIGYDINCGVRLLVSPIKAKELSRYIEKLATEIYRVIPSGVGKGGNLKTSKTMLDAILNQGIPYMVQEGYGTDHDKEMCENEGVMPDAQADAISKKAKHRGYDQLGTLGSGNHFLEIQEIVEVYDTAVAQKLGLEVGMTTVMIHCGSRGLGHQVCTDYVQAMMRETPPQQMN
ncbi:MAG: RtcB family protein, partial [Candidatus Babeliales bacterium]